MPEKNTVSVVMVSYYTGPVLNRSVDAVLRQKSLHDLIIVNNGNPEEDIARLKKLAEGNEKIKIIDGHGNIGFSGGCNIGSKEAKGEYIVLLQPDCVLMQDNTFVRIVAEIKEKPQAVLAGIRMFDVSGEIYKKNILNLVTLKTLFSHFSGIHKIASLLSFKSIYEKEQKEETETRMVDGIASGFMMMKMVKFRDNGGFDERCFIYAEDFDLCMRIYKRGGKILYLPSLSAIRLKGGRDIATLFIEREKRAGILHYLRKHYKKPMPPLYKKPFHDIFYRIMVFIIKIVFMTKGAFLLLKLYFDKENIKEEAGKMRIRQQIVEEKVKTVKSTIKNAEPVILTGATGQVGLHILRRLVVYKVNTFAIYHNHTVDLHSPELEWVAGDLTTDFINLGERKAKTLIHATRIWKLPRHLKRFSDMGIKRLICFSCYTQASGSEPKSIYEREVKQREIKAEESVIRQCKEFGINYTILHPAMIYGDGLDEKITAVAKFINRFKFFPVAKFSDGMRQPVHAEDVAEAALKIINMKKTFGKTYSLPGIRKITYRSMIENIFTVLGKKERIIHIPFLAGILDGFSLLSGKRSINGEMIRRMSVDMIYDDTEAKADFKYSPREFVITEQKDVGL